MPNLDFYAVDDDQTAVLSALFDLREFRVFEAYSRPGDPLREFAATSEIPQDPHGPFLMLYARESGPEPTAVRIDSRPDALADATFRYRCSGWGLIGLHFGNVFRERELRCGHTNHNTERRARKWAEIPSNLSDPAAWNWPAVTRASGRVNRIIRAMAVRKIGSHPVLPQAAQLITRAGLHHEYGSGIHATASPGMLRRAASRLPDPPEG